MFLHELIEALQKWKWEVDCVNITLTQNDATEPTVFSGPGYLRQGEGGTVEYKMYPTTAHSWNVWEKQFGGVEGKLIESSRYYTLKATDRFGRCWEWWCTMPDIGASALETGVHHFIDGKAHELTFSYRSGLPAHVFNLKMFFFAEAEIPCNTKTEIITLAGGLKRQTSSLLNLAQFSTPIGKFHISNQAGLVLVELDSEEALPQYIEIRIVEALSLVSQSHCSGISSSVTRTASRQFACGGSESFRTRRCCHRSAVVPSTSWAKFGVCSINT